MAWAASSKRRVTLGILCCFPAENELETLGQRSPLRFLPPAVLSFLPRTVAFCLLPLIGEEPSDLAGLSPPLVVLGFEQPHLALEAAHLPLHPSPLRRMRRRHPFGDGGEGGDIG